MGFTAGTRPATRDQVSVLLEIGRASDEFFEALDKIAENNSIASPEMLEYVDHALGTDTRENYADWIDETWDGAFDHDPQAVS
jgi:hypothetical protein